MKPDHIAPAAATWVLIGGLMRYKRTFVTVTLTGHTVSEGLLRWGNQGEKVITRITMTSTPERV